MQNPERTHAQVHNKPLFIANGTGAASCALFRGVPGLHNDFERSERAVPAAHREADQPIHIAAVVEHANHGLAANLFSATHRKMKSSHDRHLVVGDGVAIDNDFNVGPLLDEPDSKSHSRTPQS